jgi:hypothetical protein
MTMKPLPYTLAATAQAAMTMVALALLSSGALAAMTEPYVTYTVKPKDTLQGLSRSLLKQPSQWLEVAKLNGMKNPNKLSLGQVINVPRSLLNLSSQPRLATPGKILSVQGDVKIGGQSVQAGANVPEGARIETAADSSVIVQLGDGSKVQMMPKTLAEVTSQHGYAMRDPSNSASTTWFSGAIRLVSGVLDTLANKQASRLSPLTVTTPTSIIGVRGTQFRVAFEDPASGVSRTEVLEGKVQAENPSQNANASLNGGFGAAINPKEREIKVVSLLPALPQEQLPDEVQRTNIQSPTPDRAEWVVGSLSGASGYRAQFATDEKFALIQSDFKSNTPAINISALPNGTYYARVRGVDPSGIEGFDAIKRVQIKTTPIVIAPIELIWPKELSIGATADYSPEGMLLKFYGKSTDLPQQLTVQIARDAAFTQDVQTVAINADGSMLLRNVTAGERSYIRFSSAATAKQPAGSAVFTLDVPGNWGSTVLGMTQALQPVR